MTTQKQFKIVALKVSGYLTLQLTFADGFTTSVELHALVDGRTELSQLHDFDFFTGAKIDEFGSSIFWNDDIDFAADNLRNLAIEQSGGIGHERIWNWMHDNNLTIDQAAAGLGLSRRMLMYYRSGEKQIPRTVWLACLGWQAVQPTGSGLPKDLKGFPKLVA